MTRKNLAKFYVYWKININLQIKPVINKKCFQRLELPPDAISDNEFKKYKQQILGNMKLNKIDEEMLEWYIKTEFIWQMIIGSQLRETKISHAEIDNYSKSNKIKLNEKNEKMIENILIQQKATEISQSLMEKMKKFYLIDIRV